MKHGHKAFYCPESGGRWIVTSGLYMTRGGEKRLDDITQKRNVKQALQQTLLIEKYVSFYFKNLLEKYLFQAN